MCVCGKSIFYSPLSPAYLQTSMTRPHGGLWNLWWLVLKKCSKQSVPCPVAMSRADQTPLKSMERLSLKAVAFGSDAKKHYLHSLADPFDASSLIKLYDRKEKNPVPAG